jgi:hypothetical protein
VIVAKLLNEVQVKGITLTVDGDKLHYKGNKSALTPELIAELREHKAEILSLMKCGKCGTPLAGPVDQCWRVLLSTGAVYLCTAACVLDAYPWRMEVANDNCN